MPNTCGNCDCADKSLCGKGNQYTLSIVDEVEYNCYKLIYSDAMAMEGCGCGNGCSCGPSCGCSGCSCCK